MTVTIDRTPVPTAAFPTVTLADLDARAALQTRVDRKYLVQVDDLPAFLDALPPGTAVLDIDGHRCFGYRSTYFDTPDLRCYLDAAHRRRRRFKVRTRVYTDSGLCLLEVKTRDGRRRTVKSRTAYPADAGNRLTPAAASLVGSITGDGDGAPSLRPTLATSYRRTTFVLPGEATRVTVDVDLAVALPGEDPVGLGPWAVVETKGGHRPTPTDHGLWSLGHRPARISKYGTGLALLRPDLPAHKWHRTLARIRRSPS